MGISSMRTRKKKPAAPKPDRPAPELDKHLPLNTFVQIFHDKHHYTKDERFCFILGSGAARTAGVPTGGELVDRWLVEMHDMQQRDADRLRPPHAPIAIISNALTDLEKTRLSKWAQEEFKDLPGFTFAQRAQFYGQIFYRRFRSVPSVGEDFLRTLMEDSKPTLGYHFLARILSQTRHHLVITTNFDHLVEKSVAVCSGLAADTFGSAELAEYLSREQHGPAVAKIHGDIRLKTYNAVDDIDKLRQEWEEPLRVLLRRYTPVFVGYGGNDPGFMRFLCAELPRLMGDRLCYWVARKLDDFHEQSFRAEFAQLSCARLVECPGFIELMLKLNNVFGFEPLPDHLRKTADDLAAEIEAAERKAREELSRSEAASFGVFATRTRDAARVETIPAENRNWHDWRDLALSKTTLAEKLAVLQEGIQLSSESPALRALRAQLESGHQPTLAHAEAEARQAVADAEKRFGPEGEETLSTFNSLANLLSDKGDYAEAEPLYRRALDARERTLGKEHPDTLISANNLAILLKAKGDYAEAEPLCRRALDARERTLGKEHPDTLGSVNNLANLLSAKGDYAGAEPLYRRALDARERTLGNEHPDTLSSVNNLANLLTDQCDYAGAEPLYRRVLEARERILGKSHPKTAKIAFNFSLLREKQGNLREAILLNQQAIAAAEASLPADHPDRIVYEENLADLRAQIAAASPAA